MAYGSGNRFGEIDVTRHREFGVIWYVACLVLMMPLLGLPESWAETENEFTIDFDRKTYHCSPYSEGTAFGAFWGVYARLSDGATNGVAHYFFPDRKMLSVEWCDVCTDKVLAIGVYRGSASLHIKYSMAAPESEKHLNVVHCELRESNAITDSQFFILSDRDLALAEQGQRPTNLMYRQHPLFDWKAIYSRLVAKHAGSRAKRK